MAWLRVDFDGEGLAYAKLTRFNPAVRVFLRVGEKNSKGVYKTGARVQGLGWIRRAMLKAVLERQYGQTANIEPVGDDLVVQVGMPAARLWARELQFLLRLEPFFDAPRIGVRNGRVTLFAQPLPGTNLEEFVSALDADGLEARVENAVDLEPWEGLEPAIPESLPQGGQVWLHAAWVAQIGPLAKISAASPDLRLALVLAPRGLRADTPAVVSVMGLQEPLGERTMSYLGGTYGPLERIDANTFGIHLPHSLFEALGDALPPAEVCTGHPRVHIAKGRVHVMVPVAHRDAPGLLEEIRRRLSRTELEGSTWVDEGANLPVAEWSSLEEKVSLSVMVSH